MLELQMTTEILMTSQQRQFSFLGIDLALFLMAGSDEFQLWI